MIAKLSTHLHKMLFNGIVWHTLNKPKIRKYQNPLVRVITSEGERLVTLDTFSCAIEMQLTYHWWRLITLCKKTRGCSLAQPDPPGRSRAKLPWLLLNKVSAMNCCLCQEWLDRRKSLQTPAS